MNMKDVICIIVFSIISILSFYWAITYNDEEFPILFRILNLINGIGFGLGAISGYTGWF